MKLLDWFPSAILAACCWAIVNLCDQHLIRNRFRSITARMFMDAGVGLTTCVPIIPFLGAHDGKAVLCSMAVGLILLAFNLLYYKAIRIGDPSSVAGQLQVVPAFSAVLGYLCFAETFPLSLYFGLATVIVGVFLISVGRVQKNQPPALASGNARAFVFFVLPGSAIISIGYALQKYLLHGTTPWEVFFWGRVASFLAVGIACAFSGRLRREVHEGVFSASAGTLTFAAGVEWVNFTGVLLLIIAYAHGPMTLVTVAAASQPIFVIAGSAILAWLGFRSRPVSVRSGLLTIAVRTLGAICLLVGLYWMYKQV